MNIKKKLEEMAVQLQKTQYNYFQNKRVDAIDTLEDIFYAMQSYFDTILRNSVLEKFASDKYYADYQRVVNMLNVANEICASIGLDPFAEIDTSDQDAVNEFVQNCLAVTFADALNTTA